MFEFIIVWMSVHLVNRSDYDRLEEVTVSIPGVDRIERESRMLN